MGAASARGALRGGAGGAAAFFEAGSFVVLRVQDFLATAL
jgi:hypothetical protein